MKAGSLGKARFDTAIGSAGLRPGASGQLGNETELQANTARATASGTLPVRHHLGPGIDF
jgi:hypothetical protein